MSKREIEKFSDVKVFKREVYESELGYFTNIYNENLSVCDFIQDSVSHINKTGTVKGLHFIQEDSAKEISSEIEFWIEEAF